MTVFFSAGYNQSRAEWVEWIADTELGALDYDNINRSAFEPDERSDKLLFARANLGRLYQFKDETRLSITANIDGRVHDAWRATGFFDVRCNRIYLAQVWYRCHGPVAAVSRFRCPHERQ